MSFTPAAAALEFGRPARAAFAPAAPPPVAKSVPDALLESLLVFLNAGVDANTVPAFVNLSQQTSSYNYTNAILDYMRRVSSISQLSENPAWIEFLLLSAVAFLSTSFPESASDFWSNQVRPLASRYAMKFFTSALERNCQYLEQAPITALRSPFDQTPEAKQILQQSIYLAGNCLPLTGADYTPQQKATLTNAIQSVATNRPIPPAVAQAILQVASTALRQGRTADAVGGVLQQAAVFYQQNRTQSPIAIANAIVQRFGGAGSAVL